ncbi:craniofacial development protein 2-like [Penaeus monodon]|uniref:craniofacial development protein 2-like n=1 Tax=Penaeus monodon TaxID=6687 RepID=UPI0018A7015A|nr:craniofacial development protein 2-like [Penaeus monodon]
MLLVKIKASPVKVNILAAYAPTADAEDQQNLKAFIALLMNYCHHVEPLGLGERTECGDRLIDSCRKKDLVITNTWFNVYPRRRYTWISPGDRAKSKQTVVISSRYRNKRRSPRQAGSTQSSKIGSNLYEEEYCIRATDSHIFHETEHVNSRWEEYVQELFDNEQGPEYKALEMVTSSPPILSQKCTGSYSKQLIPEIQKPSFGFMRIRGTLSSS